MFKFNFDVHEENAISSLNTKTTEPLSNAQNEEICIEWYESEEIVPSKELLENLDVYALNSVEKQIDDIYIKYTVSGFLPTNAPENLGINKAEQNHSDLLPGVYEGGAKIWECTEDLLLHMHKTYDRNYWKGKRVLDLGCGAGLLGIYAYKCNAAVEFQDYNSDVLRQITIPILLLNVELPYAVNIEQLSTLLGNVKFFSGDWEKYAQLTKNTPEIDIILTCETIYNPANQQKLLNTFDKRLSKDGIVLVAAKTHYFGVGGGLRQFEALITQDKRFTTKVVNCTQECGISREILLLSRL